MPEASALYQGINVASLTCSTLVIIVIFTIMSINKVLADRVSLRFTLGTSIFDCMRATALLFILRKSYDGPLCTVLSLSAHWFTLMYLFLTASIALNLQLVILKGLRFQPIWEFYYWGISVSAATIILIFPLAFGKLGLNKSSGYCEFIELGAVVTFSWRMLSYLLWVVLTCLYCTVIVIKVILQLQQKIELLNQVDAGLTMSLGADECYKIMCNLKRLIRRILLYCLIPIISHIGFVLLTLYRLSEKRPPFFLEAFAMVGLALPGVLNCLAFMMDPALYVAIISLKKHESVAFKEDSSPASNPPTQKQTPLDSVVVIPESSPTATEFDATLLSPASSLGASNRKYSWPLPPRPAAVSTMINSVAMSSYQSLSLYQNDNDPIYSQLNARLSTFIQGL